MGKYSKHKDIEAVLVKVENELQEIEESYQNSLDQQIVPDSLLVEVKSCLSNLRSVLDYIWCKVPNVSSKAHFPNTNSLLDFNKRVEGIDNKFTDIVEKWQGYNGNSWWVDFCSIRNKHEHLTLIPQVRRETKEFSIKNSGMKGSGMTMRGCNFVGNVNFQIGGVVIPINEKTQFPEAVDGVDIEKKIWVNFLFDGSLVPDNFPKNISVLPFLKLSLENTKKIISDLEKEL